MAIFQWLSRWDAQERLPNEALGIAERNPELAISLHPQLRQICQLASRYREASKEYSGHDLRRLALVLTLGHHPPANQQILHTFADLLKWHGPPKPAPKPSITDRFDRDSTYLLNRTRLAKCCLKGLHIHWSADPLYALAVLKTVQDNRSLQPLARDLLGLMRYRLGQQT